MICVEHKSGTEKRSRSIEGWMWLLSQSVLASLRNSVVVVGECLLQVYFSDV